MGARAVGAGGRAAAEAVALELGIDDVVAEVLPSQKADEVERLQGRDQSVAFVGDGGATEPAEAEEATEAEEAAATEM